MEDEDLEVLNAWMKIEQNKAQDKKNNKEPNAYKWIALRKLEITEKGEPVRMYCLMSVNKVSDGETISQTDKVVAQVEEKNPETNYAKRKEESFNRIAIYAKVL